MVINLCVEQNMSGVVSDARTFSHIHEDGVGAIDILVWEGCLVVAVPQRQGNAVALQLQPC